MAYYRVPRCSTAAKEDLPGVSFQETPADEELEMKKWIGVIRHDCLTPNTTSNYNKVRSKLFMEIL